MNQSLTLIFNSLQIELKELPIHSYNVTIPPNDIIPLNGLNVSAYSNLHYYILSSLSLEDVSS